MKFEVINSDSKTLMQTTTWVCIPDKDTLKSMSAKGYKFKLDGKTITAKKIGEKIKEASDGEDN